jgi:hypothetical protein
MIRGDKCMEVCARDCYKFRLPQVDRPTLPSSRSASNKTGYNPAVEGRPSESRSTHTETAADKAATAPLRRRRAQSDDCASRDPQRTHVREPDELRRSKNRVHKLRLNTGQPESKPKLEASNRRSEKQHAKAKRITRQVFERNRVTNL